MKPMTEKHLAILRRHMVEIVEMHFDLASDEIGSGTLDAEIRRAMLEVPRHLFVPSSIAAIAYQDGPLPIGFDKTISQPFIGAAMLQLAGIEPGARVLEVGSGSGRDARALEEAGLSVRRTDITPAFVHLLRDAGFVADVVDPLVDDLSDPAAPGTPYAGVWADASLLHVDRDDLPRVLSRLADATVAGGVLFASVKEGDGEDWSVHGNVTAPRFFTYWREGPLRSALAGAGWRVVGVERHEGTRERWLFVLARRG